MDFGELIRARKEGIAQFSVGGAIFDLKGNLLVLRRKKEDSYPGLYEIPGGKVEKNESIEEALRREIYEETGLTFDKIIHHIGFFDYLENKMTRQFNFIVSVKKVSDIFLSEHDDARWITSEREIECTAEMKKVIQKAIAYWRSK